MSQSAPKSDGKVVGKTLVSETGKTSNVKEQSPKPSSKEQVPKDVTKPSLKEPTPSKEITAQKVGAKDPAKDDKKESSDKSWSNPSSNDGWFVWLAVPAAVFVGAVVAFRVLSAGRS